MIDITIYETGSGGDANLLGSDLEQTDSFFNMVYLAFFGGNVEASTTGNEVESEQRFDWWGNSILLENDKELQFNSETERTLNNVAINSEGRSLIEESAKADLNFMNNFANIEVLVKLENANKVSIYVNLTELSNQENKNFQFIWDASKSELIESIIL